MQILLLSATPHEIELYKNNNPKVEVLISGVGIPATLYNLQKKLNEKKFDFVIQAGIGGSFNNEIKPGDTYLIRQDTFADIGAEEKRGFTPFVQNGLMNGQEFPFTDGWLPNPHTEVFKKSTLSWVDGITINKISDSFLQKFQYIDLFNAKIESMEGAALHYVCLQEKVPFLQVRAVSNFVGERDKSKWQTEKAVASLNSELTKIINLIKK